jgi:hypothetical protein
VSWAGRAGRAVPSWLVVAGAAVVMVSGVLIIRSERRS